MHGVVIQILDDADAAFRILGAGLPTVLSVTTMFADKPHRLNGRMRAAISCFDDLASGYRTRGWATRAAGYRAAISCYGTKQTCRLQCAMSEFEVPAQPVEATQALNLSAGVSNCKVSRGRSFS